MKNKIIFVAGLVIVLVAASFFIFDGKEEPAREIQPEIKIASREVSVYVSGQVKTPAVVNLEDNGKLKIIDAVNAAGGLTEFADTEGVNLAEPLNDGQHVHIPTKEIFFEELPAKNVPSKSSKTSNELININTADATELQKIKGVGPKISERIVEYRDQNGTFAAIEDIKKVKGIGDKTFEKMKDSITVN